MKQVSFFFSISDYVCMYIHETGQGILVNGDLRARGAKNRKQIAKRDATHFRQRRIIGIGPVI